mmetsp:Transcript_29476/g.44732  ORF Transcript_29476/g.44732 Transcript_29476/m.44732 type:complete len:135 (+) Transcript_29476:1678-2082(+)
MNSALQPAYTLTIADAQKIVQESERVRFVRGNVPKVEILADKVMGNKKYTSITGLEIYQIDLDEFCSHLQHKCASSVSKELLISISTPKNPKHKIQVQGNQIPYIMDVLTERYMVPSKYIVSEDKTSKKKKKQQ